MKRSDFERKLVEANIALAEAKSKEYQRYEVESRNALDAHNLRLGELLNKHRASLRKLQEDFRNGR